jgi:uncharacterized Zn finger protein
MTDTIKSECPKCGYSKTYKANTFQGGAHKAENLLVCADCGHQFEKPTSSTNDDILDSLVEIRQQTIYSFSDFEDAKTYWGEKASNEESNVDVSFCSPRAGIYEVVCETVLDRNEPSEI